MNKPFYMLPFIFVYRAVSFCLRAVLKFIKFFNVGLFFTLFLSIDIVIMSIYYFIKFVLFGFIYTCELVYKFIRYAKIGFTYLSYLVYQFIRYFKLGFIYVLQYVFKFFRYALIGFIAPFVIISRTFDLVGKAHKKWAAKRQLEKEKHALAKERNRQIKEENKKRLAEAKKREKEALALKKQQRKEMAKKDVYINENVTLEKKTFAQKLNVIFSGIGTYFVKLKDKVINNSFVRNVKNKNDLKREALLLDFEGADAEKSDEKVMYKYVAKNPDGKIIKGYFPAYSKVEVHSFLLSEGNEVYSIETNKWIQRRFGNGSSKNNYKIKTKDLIFFCTQLSTYIKAGIPLVEALRILSRQFKNKNYVRIFKSIIYELTMGDSFSNAMDKQGNAFPKLLVNMVKSAEMTGVLPEVLDDMADYFTEVDKTHKQMVTALTYPAIILVLSIAATIFIMVWVVPQFVGVYEGIDGATIPPITQFVLDVSNFLQEYWVWVVLGIVGSVVIFIYLFKNVKSFKALIQWVVMHIPVFGNVIIYNEVTMFTKTFASLLMHNVFITDSMEILNKITNNEIYKMLILETIANLAKGEKISLAFKDHWAFPLPAYEMIATGEMTGQLPEMMQKVSSYYQDLHRNATTRIKTFIEPIMILFLTVVVGGIVLAIVIPMFSVYTQIQV